MSKLPQRKRKRYALRWTCTINKSLKNASYHGDVDHEQYDFFSHEKEDRKKEEEYAHVELYFEDEDNFADEDDG